jgi:hypothetical protein
MRRVLWVLGLCLVGVAGLVAGALPAAAAAPVSLTVSTVRVGQGGVVRVSGQCEANTSGVVISAAFLHNATHDFAGVGAVPFTTGASGRFSVVARIPSTRAAGTYAVTARCGGGNLGISRRITVVAVTLPHTGADPFLLPATALGLLLLIGGGTLIGVSASRSRPRGAGSKAG